MDRLFVDVAGVEIDVPRNVRTGIDDVALVDGPGEEPTFVEDRREHGPVADMSVTREGGVVDEHIPLVDVVTERANHEAKGWGHGADVHRQAVVHRQHVTPGTHQRAGKVFRPVENRVSRRGEDGLGHLAQDALEAGIDDREGHRVDAGITAVEGAGDSGDLFVPQRLYDERRIVGRKERRLRPHGQFPCCRNRSDYRRSDGPPGKSIIAHPPAPSAPPAIGENVPRPARASAAGER